VVPWTEDERELWRRADAGEVFDLAQDHDEEEPMTEGMIQTVDDLAKPTLARLKEIVGEIESRERQAAALRVDAARFIAVLDALGWKGSQAHRARREARPGQERSRTALGRGGSARR
jgi:hypothetical protein